MHFVALILMGLVALLVVSAFLNLLASRAFWKGLGLTVLVLGMLVTAAILQPH